MASGLNSGLGSLENLENHHTLSDRVYQRLRDAILDGRLASGQWLRQEILSNELGTSQLPVREAIRRLASEGLAVRIPYRGVQVVEYSPEDIIDMFNVRLVLECMAVRYAATRISPGDLEKLKKNLVEANRYKKNDQMPLRRNLNAEFHLTICRASNHRYLIRQTEMMWSWFPSTILYEGMRRQQEFSRSRLERENKEHQVILQALVRKDAAKAEEATRRHIRNLSQELAEVLGISLEKVKKLLD
jgi:GntR family transcriptional regulator, rspAB operon transcriptional repressor